MAIIPIYSDTLVSGTVTIAASGTASTVFSCLGIATGTASLRRIEFPAAWTACDVTFHVYKSLADVSPTSLFMSDFINTDQVVVPSTAAGLTISLLNATVFDSINFFNITCSVAQASSRTVTMWLQPIIQGAA